jgi:putative SOS response-associated peptidase YedK
MKEIHHRMPVIVDPRAYGGWLDSENQDSDGLQGLLQAHAVTDLVFHPVSKQVNSARTNDPSNIKPIQTEFDF